MFRTHTTHVFTAVAVGILITLIGLVTLFASQSINRATESIGLVSGSIDRVSSSISRSSELISQSIDLISQTVIEEFRASDLQLATSLSQQTETYFSGLNADIMSLSLQPDIKRSQLTDETGVWALMEAHGQEYYPVIRSIVRFDFQGNPRYAWPMALNNRLKVGELAPYNLPSRLVNQTKTGEDIPLEIELIEASLREDPAGTFLLVAPVYSNVGRTEFIVYELDLKALFAGIMDVTQDSRSQLWVIDNTNNIWYEANANIPLESLLDAIPLAVLMSYTQPSDEEYDAEGVTRVATIAPIRAQGKAFVLILSHDLDVAKEQVQAELDRAQEVQNQALADQKQARTDQKIALAEQREAQAELKTIFGLSTGAVVMLALLATVLVRRISREGKRRQEEVQRRQTARTLLEMSRAINSTLDLEDVLRRILAELSKIVPYDSAAIFLLDRSKLVMVAHRGPDAEPHRIGEFEVDEGLAAYQVIQTGRPLVIHDTQLDERWKIGTIPVRSWMGIPLRVREQTVGVLNLNSYVVDRFTVEETELAEAFADQSSVALQNARLHEIEVKQFEQELHIARDIQNSLLPSTAPVLPQLEVAAVSLPARQVSGDYFQYLPMPNGQLGIAVGDVSGKGIPAAMLMAVITTALRDEVARNARPSALLDVLNLRLLERMKATHVNSALLVGMFDPPTRHLEVANGGMVQPYWRNGGGEWMLLPVGGYPLGVANRMEYGSKIITLAPGALVVMLSDGVVEAQNAAGEFYGFDRLEALLNACPIEIDAQALLDRIVAAVREHVGPNELQDDLTVVTLRSLAVGGEA
ncbi:MAG TPA: SpoIIE family protein phosphatase [Aggregatilineaceae bacterium]|nr:SpoIIE family protein phosphatase [Aggregatilineaceae bacterium]